MRPGEQLDWARLETYLHEHVGELVDPASTSTVLQFPNGVGQPHLPAALRGTELVLRRPPFGVIAPGAHDMRREHRVLSRLWACFDRAPRAFLFCDDHEVIGADFVIMERRTGEVVRGEVPASMADHPDVGRRLGLALVDAMAELHLVDPGAAGGRRPRASRRVRRASGRRLEHPLVAGPPGRRAARDGRPA